ncbi:LamG domain-containing protein [Candidatus Magnetobacterium bavaricum]|uniref:LamG domain-containing protein n=1 Tax=Candidatus Magnetobacterium bavaricum TaxID=29290 RepID=A0A0F3GTW3_9BACT|nr:LamG domain-containing protein [Candidatus Magnetobacterium bavaricum]
MYNFNGTNGYIEAPQPESIKGDVSFTVSLWMKYHSNSKDRQWILRMGEDIDVNGSAKYKGFHLLITENKLTQFGFWGDLDIQSKIDISSYEGHWVFIATVYNQNNRTFWTYINGINKNSNSPPKEINLALKKTIIAQRIETSGEAYFKGSLDDIRIYNCALSDPEISQLYKETSTPTPTPTPTPTVTPPPSSWDKIFPKPLTIIGVLLFSTLLALIIRSIYNIPWSVIKEIWDHMTTAQSGIIIAAIFFFETLIAKGIDLFIALINKKTP